MTSHEKVESRSLTVRSSAVPSEWFQPPKDEIRVRAYEKYCARNGAPGDAVADWLEAEREMVDRSSPRPVRKS